MVSAIAKYHTRPGVNQRLGSDSCFLGGLGALGSLILVLDSPGGLAVQLSYFALLGGSSSRIEDEGLRIELKPPPP
jgi:hypothetical protein